MKFFTLSLLHIYSLNYRTPIACHLLPFDGTTHNYEKYRPYRINKQKKHIKKRPGSMDKIIVLFPFYMGFVILFYKRGIRLFPSNLRVYSSDPMDLKIGNNIKQNSSKR